MRNWRAVAIIVMALLAVPAWWTTVNIAYAGCSETRSVENKEEEWIECKDNFCHTCWKFDEPIKLDFCADNAPARTNCVCRDRRVQRIISSFKCDGACNCTDDPHGRLMVLVEVWERDCATRNCLF
jgi:hypothetical protein